MIKREVQIGDCRLLLGDCLEIMPLLEKVDAVVTDPPYGIDFGSFNRTNKDSKGNRYKADKYKNGDWDKEFLLDPYYKEIKKFNCPAIVWGGNYFPILWKEPSKAIVFWHKHQPCKNFSQGELAWTSINMPARHINYPYYGNIEGNTSAGIKLHPTQKPIAVMVQCLGFLPNTETILDPFMGSGTTGVACAKLGRKFIGIELDEDYFNIACERIEKAYQQPDLFIEQPKQLKQQSFLEDGQ